MKCRGKHKDSRNTRGQTIVLLLAIIGLILMPLLGLFSFEIARIYFGVQQLQNATDAAVLTAAAQLASQDSQNSSQAHLDAMAAALKIFQANFVLGQKLSNSYIADAKGTAAATGQATLYFEFLNPVTLQVVPISNPEGKLIRLYTNYGAQPAFAKFLGLANFPISAIAKSEVPQLDFVLCFDVSGSMDDQTPVTFVNRVWDSTLHSIVYKVPSSVSGPAQGKLFDVLQPLPTGTSVNVLDAPQLLSYAYYGHLYFADFYENPRGITSLRSLHPGIDASEPPGNYPPGVANPFDGFPAFTDMVVNIDGSTVFGGYTDPSGYAFPNLATLVEASRGNLENLSAFKHSLASSVVAITSAGISPRPGYQQAYFNAASRLIQPMKDSKDASQAFLNTLYTDADVHFGLVAFHSSVGTPQQQTTQPLYNIDDATPYGFKQNYPLPLISLDPTGNNTNYAIINTAIGKCVPVWGTNIGAAVDAAVNMLVKSSRRGSNKAILLFTDGEPDIGGPLDPDPWKNARMAAVNAKNAGIPVYTIALSQNNAIIADQMAILNDTNNDPNSGGIAAISGHGATFSLVTNTTNLRQAFQNIARQLVRLVQHG